MPLTVYRLYEFIGSRFRRRRLAHFVQTFNLTNESTILDVGGYPHFWSELPLAPRITCVNLEDPASIGDLPANFTYVQGDACALEFADNAFDIAFSNSVIEHVRTFSDQQKFAREIRRIAPQLWVQTPNRGFLIEPHFIGPPLHFLPRRWQHRLTPWLSLRGWLRRGDNVELSALIDELRLLTYEEMQTLFPDCLITRERLGGLTKSLTAVRRVRETK
jgi:hypothetical protein